MKFELFTLNYFDFPGNPEIQATSKHMKTKTKKVRANFKS